MTGGRLVEYLEHLHEAGRQIQVYVEGVSKNAFMKDKRTQQAVILNLVVVGEVAARLLRDHEAFSRRVS